MLLKWFFEMIQFQQKFIDGNNSEEYLENIIVLLSIIG